MDICLTLYGIIDILKTLNTGVFIEGKIKEDREIILKKYWEKEMMIDLICTLIFPISMIFSSDVVLLVYIIRFK